jgi:hypothetical protein
VPLTRSGRGTMEEERRRGDGGAVRAGPGAAARRKERHRWRPGRSRDGGLLLSRLGLDYVRGFLPLDCFGAFDG